MWARACPAMRPSQATQYKGADGEWRLPLSYTLQAFKG